MKKIGQAFGPMKTGTIRVLIRYYKVKDCCGSCDECAGNLVIFEGRLNPPVNIKNFAEILHDVHKPYKSRNKTIKKVIDTYLSEGIKK